jgi:hypothetical protein
MRIDDDTPQMDVLETVRNVKEKLERATRGNAHLAFNTDDSYLIGLIVKTTLYAAQLRAMCEHRFQQDRGFTWALEIGEDFSAQGNSSGWRWLQR